MTLPAEFRRQLQALEAAYEQVGRAVQQQHVADAATAFAQFGQALDSVDGSVLTGHPRMVWKEMAMLLGNDAVEGRDARQPSDLDRVYLLLKGHMRRMREQMGMQEGDTEHVERLAVPPPFRNDLARAWEHYLSMGQALAADNGPEALRALAAFEAALTDVDDRQLADRAKEVWTRERSNLVRLVDRLKKAQDIQSLRAEFSPLSQEIGVLARTFGFGETHPVFELHCPMAFQGKGAVWYQNNDQARNPYFGSTMLKCADRVDRIAHEGESKTDQPQEPGDHAHH